MSDRDKVKVIVTETIQHVYLMDPDDIKTREAYEALPRLVSGQILESLPMPWNKPPAVLGRRATKKGCPMPLLLQQHTKEDSFSRMTEVTFVIPDEEGNPSIEVKATPTTMSQKPVTS